MVKAVEKGGVNVKIEYGYGPEWHGRAADKRCWAYIEAPRGYVDAMGWGATHEAAEKAAWEVFEAPGVGHMRGAYWAHKA